MVEHQLHNKDFLDSLHKLILDNLGNEDFGAKELADAAGMSQRKLNQKLRTINKSSLSRLICETRLRKAHELLQEEDLTAAEVAYKVGFGSATYFNKCFHDFFGYPPGKIRKGELNTERETIQWKNISGYLSGRPFLKAVIYIFSGLILISGIFLVSSVFIKISSANDTNEKSKSGDISIAILPFKNLCDSAANQYFMDGLMEDILTRLSGIHSIRVVSRASVEQFRGSNKSSHEIAKKLNVQYLVTGCGQKYNNSYLLRVQLLDGKNDKQLWSESYRKEIRATKDIFGTQSLIAQSIATKLKASITADELQSIEKSPTVELSAYYYYLEGNEELLQSWYPEYKPDHLKKADFYFRKALETDSTFAQAYIGLGFVYWQKLDRDLSISDNKIIINYLDSMLILSDIALYYDPDLCNSYCMRAAYYSYFRNETEKALEENTKAIECNRNDWFGNYQRADLYTEISLVNALEIAYKAACLGSGNEVSQSLHQIGSLFCMAGFPERGKFYFLEAYKMDKDSVRYSVNLAFSEAIGGDFLRYLEKFENHELTLNACPISLVNSGALYLFLGKQREALEYYRKYMSQNRANERNLQSLYRYIGYAYLQNGNRQEANNYFKKTIEANDSLIKYSFPSDNYGLAGVYAIMGDRDKAYDYLNIYNQKKSFTSLDIIYLKNDPLFKYIRNEPRFRLIVKNAESKFQSEHTMVKKWLDQNKELN